MQPSPPTRPTALVKTTTSATIGGRGRTRQVRGSAENVERASRTSSISFISNLRQAVADGGAVTAVCGGDARDGKNKDTERTKTQKPAHTCVATRAYARSYGEAVAHRLPAARAGRRSRSQDVGAAGWRSRRRNHVHKSSGGGCLARLTRWSDCKQRQCAYERTTDKERTRAGANARLLHQRQDSRAPADSGAPADARATLVRSYPVSGTIAWAFLGGFTTAGGLSLTRRFDDDQ